METMETLNFDNKFGMLLTIKLSYAIYFNIGNTLDFTRFCHNCGHNPLYSGQFIGIVPTALLVIFIISYLYLYLYYINVNINLDM
ncbi:hypothetical protein C1646_712338, partial [Rhizophagus diaphanus]